MLSDSKIKIRAMFWVLMASIVIAAIKFYAFFYTGSNAIFTDALESIINVVAGAFALFSVYYASLPKDENHPYGHGKIEFLSAGFEGGLIFFAGISIFIKSILGFIHPAEIKSLDVGIILSVVTGVANFFLGKYLINLGNKKHSVTLIADGKHLLSDTYTSIGLVVGLVLIYFTGLVWLDNVVALVFAALIIRTGFVLLKQSINDLLDEADYKTMDELMKIMNKHRRSEWIDVHNLRLLKYGLHLHVDCHVTLPWYFTLEESHKHVTDFETLVNNEMNGRVEFFIHSDPCLPFSCSICSIENCAKRQHKFENKVEWNMHNLLPNKKHGAI